MKKQYVQPLMKVAQVKATQMICDSITFNKDVEIDNSLNTEGEAGWDTQW